MKSINKTLVMALLFGGITTTTLAQNQCPANLLNQPSPQSFEVGQNKQSSLSYYDLCLDSLSYLKSEVLIAKDEWIVGSANAATQRLYNALERSVSDLLANYNDLPPYTADTIISAYNISRILKKSVASNIRNKRMSLQVQFLSLVKLVELSSWTYENIDSVYYVDSVDSYFGFSFSFSDFPLDYFKNVKKLAVKYIDILQEVDNALADNKVEMDISYGFVHGARSVLKNNVYNRQFCPANARAEQILNLIKRFRCREVKVPGRRMIDVLRSEIRELENEIRVVNLNDRSC